VGELRMQYLERDRPVVAKVLCQIDRGHAPAAQLTFDLIAARQSSLERGKRDRQLYTRNGCLMV
jgi:hypothetical protein